MDAAKKRAIEFGKRLNAVREKNGDSLRDIEKRTGLNSGYLSQLENGKITHPSPSILERVAKGYGIRFEDLLTWTGYVSGPPELVTPSQAVALSTVASLGEPSDDELQALRAIVEILQKNRTPTFAAPSDMPLDDEAVAAIRTYVRALLREAEALGQRPTPLEDIQAAARLVLSGDLTLDPRDRERLFERFGRWVNLAWKRLQGSFDYRTSAIWVAPDLHEMKRRFVVSHEIGHAILPAHKQTFAYIDDFTCLPPFARHLFEREANQAAVETLFQCGQATEEFDSSAPSLDQICLTSVTFGASVIATARYVVETSKRPIAIAVAHINGRGLGPTHIYASRRFEAAFGWLVGHSPQSEIRAALHTSHSGNGEPWVVRDVRSETRIVDVEKMNTGYAAIVLFIPQSRTHAVKQRLVAATQRTAVLPDRGR